KEKRRHMKKSIQRGAAAYIVKPFRIEELIILIERILSDQFLLLLKQKENLTMERDMILAGITSLINALEARDSYTKGHSESVATIVTGMAELGGMDQKKIERLTFGARLHDIGKIGVPDALLFKRGKLTKDEYDQIKLHSEMGSNILAPIPSLADVLPLVMHHHERFDGRGYPHGLKGEEIPLWARMTAVADTFDAMSSDRPYRKGMEFEHIMMVIKDVRGSQLCPDCVDLFLKWTLANGFPVQHPRGLHFDPS
ncbi:MAG: HD-GYP domain-containing protein, partial [Desulfobulbaceae bacterium]|nr:HD-GYP domain-containing protein [Desulfobulbaceae bacterium]